jgi:RNA-directed DNA polymerase
MARVARKVKDKRVLRLIRRYLTAGILTNGLETARSEGTPQGSPLSPLLSNILLDDLDKELERRGHRFCRYADDCNIYVKSKRAGERVMASVTGYLELKLKLKGWIHYFKLAEVKGIFEELDGWIRRKLRCILWRQWKRSYTRVRKLMKRGLTEARAWQSAQNGGGPWWNSGASHMNEAFKKSYFDQMGLVALLDTIRKIRKSSRTAVYGTVRTVV